jgi:alpha-ketoglutarate-dependent taurine dioxygenase
VALSFSVIADCLSFKANISSFTISPGMPALMASINFFCSVCIFSSSRVRFLRVTSSCTRPLIQQHPVTGKTFLNFNEAFVNHIVGLTTNEYNALKTWLTNHMNKPETQMRWKWQAGDMAMWDNIITMHYAVADYLPAYRCMNRITVISDKREGQSRSA